MYDSTNAETIDDDDDLRVPFRAASPLLNGNSCFPEHNTTTTRTTKMKFLPVAIDMRKCHAGTDNRVK